MCFVLYIATKHPLPIVAWDDQTRDIHTEELTEHDEAVRDHFSLTNVYYIGSDTQCGCGYRNATYQNGSWPEEEWHPDDDLSHVEAQPNHERLVDFIQRHLPEHAPLEFFGMWEGDYSSPTLSSQNIPLDRLLDLDFYFRDRGHYTTTNTKAGKSTEATG